MKSTLLGNQTHADSAAELRRHLFYETSHSPAIADLVGYEKAREIVDFCFIANPYYPTREMLDDLQRNLPNLIKSYPSSNPLMSQKNLADVLHVDPEHLIIGNGATELIALIDMTLIDRMAVPIPTFGEYIEKMKDQRDAELYPLDPESGYTLHLEDYLAWVHQRKLESLLIINPGNPTGQFIPLEEMVEFLQRARDLELVIVDESFIDFSGDPIPSLLPLADRFTNLLIVRSMSKHCGVPGLRLGYCYSANLQSAFVVGLQFHPERMLKEYAGNSRVWQAFAAAAHRTHRSRLKMEAKPEHRLHLSKPSISRESTGAHA
jgi:histidinol-phosphate/aromatic aminotransferase/cobyric acid decarboxylase-like protein